MTVSTGFECRCPLNKLFFRRAVPAHVLSMTGAVLEGQRLDAHTEEKACLAPSLRHIGGELTTHLIHVRGAPLVGCW